MRSGVAAFGSKPGAAKLMVIALACVGLKLRCCDRGVKELTAIVDCNSSSLAGLLVEMPGTGKLLGMRRETCQVGLACGQRCRACHRIFEMFDKIHR